MNDLFCIFDKGFQLLTGTLWPIPSYAFYDLHPRLKEENLNIIKFIVHGWYLIGYALDGTA